MTEQTTPQTAQTNSGEQTTDQQAQAQQNATDTGQQGQQQQQASQDSQQSSDKKELDAKAQGAPDKYEFKPPEGQQFDPEFLNVYSETAKELNLSQENAQKLIDKVSPVLEKQQLAKIEAVRTEWFENSKADKEFGGDKLEANVGVAKQSLDKFGTPELKEFLNITGLGNHPEMIRFFYRVGKDLSPDTFVRGHKEGDKPGPKNFNDLAAKLYTN
jgi:hypothetical protein